MAEGVDAGGPEEHVEVVGGVGGVMADPAAQEAEEFGWGEGGLKVGLQEAGKAGRGDGGGEGERR